VFRACPFEKDEYPTHMISAKGFVSEVRIQPPSDPNCAFFLAACPFHFPTRSDPRAWIPSKVNVFKRKAGVAARHRNR